MPTDPGTAGGARRRCNRSPKAAAAHREPHAGEGGEQSPETATQAAKAGGGRKVGYRQPPESGQFKPGQSGNPRGRPKGARNRTRNVLGDGLIATLLAEAERSVPDPAGGTEKLPMRQAMVRTLFNEALRGKSMKVALETLNRAEVETRQRQREVITQVENYQREARVTIADCLARGMSPPDLYPHPDEIFISHEAGTVTILGELSALEKMTLAKTLWKAREEPAAEVAALTALLDIETYAPYREALLEDIQAEQKIVDRCNRMLYLLRRRRPTGDAVSEIEAEEPVEQAVAEEPPATRPRRARTKFQP